VPTPGSNEITENMTREEIGQVFGISRERVRQIEDDALRKMGERAPLLLHMMLAREGRTELAQQCFDFISTRAELDLAGWRHEDIFAHN